PPRLGDVPPRRRVPDARPAGSRRPAGPRPRPPDPAGRRSDRCHDVRARVSGRAAPPAPDDPPPEGVPATLTVVTGPAATASALAATLPRIERAAGALATARVARRDETLP